MSCCKTKILYQSNLSCECVPFINQRTLTPFPTGKAVQERSPSSGSRGSRGVVGLSRFFAIVLREFAPGFSLFSFSFDRIRPDSTGFSFDQIWQIPTIFAMPKKSKFRHCSTPTFIDKFRHSPCQISTNFDNLQFSISLDQFRQTLYFRGSHYYYMQNIHKIFIFLIDKFRPPQYFWFALLHYYYMLDIPKIYLNSFAKFRQLFYFENQRKKTAPLYYMPDFKKIYQFLVAKFRHEI